MAEHSRSLLRLLGTGLIAMISGLEVTNIGVFSYVGIKYGLVILWAVVFSMILSSLAQQIAAEVGSHANGCIASRIHSRLGEKALTLMAASLYISNTATIALNIAGAAIAIDLLLGVWWVYVALFLAGLSLSLSAQRALEDLERVLAALSLSLSLYLVLAAWALLENPGMLVDALKYTIIPSTRLDGDVMLDMLMIFGAAAAPYSVIYQAQALAERGGVRELPNEMRRILVGLVLSSVICASISISSGWYARKAGLTVSSAEKVFWIIKAIKHPLVSTLFTVGIVAAALLSIQAMSLCNAYLADVVKGGWAPLSEIVESNRNLTSTAASITLPLFALLSYASIKGFVKDCFIEVLAAASIITSLTSWIPVLIMVMLFMRIEDVEMLMKVFAILLIIVLVSVNLLGLIGMVMVT